MAPRREGLPDAILTGREELGFPKLFADIPELTIDHGRGTAGGSAAWFGHRFIEFELKGLREASGEKKLPGGGGPQMWFKYMPRTSIGGVEPADVAYVTTSLPPPGAAGDASPIWFADSSFRRWTAEKGRIR